MSFLARLRLYRIIISGAKPPIANIAKNQIIGSIVAVCLELQILKITESFPVPIYTLMQKSVITARFVRACPFMYVVH
jgi:hypothetical protein